MHVVTCVISRFLQAINLIIADVIFELDCKQIDGIRKNMKLENFIVKGSRSFLQ